MLSHVIVDPDDPAFNRPTKPIGPFFSRERRRGLLRATDGDRRGQRPWIAASSFTAAEVWWNRGAAKPCWTPGVSWPTVAEDPGLSAGI
jgi:hypothetical protein